MYHIAKDKRAEKSAALICEGLLACLSEKDLSQITVTDLWKASGVSRATFYRLFDNVLDVMTYRCEQIVADIVDALSASPAQERTYRQMAVTILSSAMEHCQLLAAVSENHRLDIIYGALCKQIPRLHQLYQVREEDSPSLEESFLHCFCSLTATMIDLWVRHGQEQDVDALYSEFSRITQMLEAAFAGA